MKLSRDSSEPTYLTKDHGTPEAVSWTEGTEQLDELHRFAGQKCTRTAGNYTLSSESLEGGRETDDTTWE